MSGGPVVTRQPAAAHPAVRWAAAAAGLAGAAVTARTAWRLRQSRRLLADARPYQQQPAAPTRHLLVIGDSTAVGTGAASPCDSVPGRIGRAHPDWRIDNLAANGARVSELAAQLRRMPGMLDLVLIMAGGNDVLRLSPWAQVQADLTALLLQARRRGAHVVLMPCGDVGLAPLVPPLAGAWMRWRSERLHRACRRAAHGTGVAVVDLRLPPQADPFRRDPHRCYAADGLHPSGEGYGHWFECLRRARALP